MALTWHEGALITAVALTAACAGCTAGLARVRKADGPAALLLSAALGLAVWAGPWWAWWLGLPPLYGIPAGAGAVAVAGKAAGRILGRGGRR